MAKKDAPLYTHDVEVYPNYFCDTVLRRRDRATLTLEIGELVSDDTGEVVECNDLPKLVQLFKDKKKWIVGYNSTHYDDRIINFILSNADMWMSMAYSSLLIAEAIYAFNNQIIVKGDERSHKWDDNFHTLDMMRMGKKGNQRKALKLTAVNLKWPLIQDLPFVAGEHLTLEKRERLVDYNINDVGMTDALYEYFRDDIKLRQYIHKRYGVYVMNDPDSVIGDKLLQDMYCKATGVDRYLLRDMRSEREFVRLAECIDPKINFKTKGLQEFLLRIKQKTVHTAKKKMDERVLVGNTYYDIKLGGIHSHRESEIFQKEKGYSIIDCDVTSYYPMMMIKRKLFPAHLGLNFIEILNDIVNERISQKVIYKKTGDIYAYLAQSALKIVVNALFGKTGYEHSWLYDPKCMYSVTLTGQFYLLMLIERLELAGITVFYANTDGITAIVPNDLRETYYDICSRWQKLTKLNLEFDDKYRKCVIQDVNNYLIIRDVDKSSKDYTKQKGRLDPFAWKDISNKKSFNRPIVPHALYKYWTEAIPVSETIKNHDDLYDFCMAQKIGKTYDRVIFEYIDYNTSQLVSIDAPQRTNRYFVTEDRRKQNVGILKKVKNAGKNNERVERICSGELIYLANDMRIMPNVEPKYKWYIKECEKIIKSMEGQMNLFA